MREVFVGDAAANIITGKDVISGNGIFMYTDLRSGTDTIADFSSGDKINIASLISGYSAGNFADYVTATAGNIIIDIDGTGASPGTNTVNILLSNSYIAVESGFVLL